MDRASLAPSAIAAALTIRADYRGPRWQVYCCKPLATIPIPALTLAVDPGGERPYTAPIALGLARSLVGASCPMLPQEIASSPGCSASSSPVR